MLSNLVTLFGFHFGQTNLFKKYFKGYSFRQIKYEYFMMFCFLVQCPVLQNVCMIKTTCTVLI